MSQDSLSVLIVEDDASVRSSIILNLDHAGYAVREATRADDALEILKEQHFDIVLCDLNMPGMDGMSFITRCKESSNSSAIVLMTAYSSPDMVVQAIQAGAYDYLAKPFTGEDLILTLRKIEAREKLKPGQVAKNAIAAQKYSFSSIVAKSKQMLDIFDTVKRLSQFSTTILITGESGTGKELLARAIHNNSPRRAEPFVAINCGAIPETLMESELFGHKKGSFTDATRDKKGLFEEASGGTIFLDEIGELPLHLQVKLLRTLQEQQIRRVGDEEIISIDVRVIAATLRDLEDDVIRGRFRDDLFYRLNVVSIHLPPLRERPEDITVLAQSFIKKHNKRHGLAIKGISAEALHCLVHYHWKGNVRELENCIERAIVLSENNEIDLDSLPEHIRAVAGTENEDSSVGSLLADDNLSIKQKTRTLEVALIKKALEKTRGNRTHAAKVLEISHRALLYKLKEYGLVDPKSADEPISEE